MRARPLVLAPAALAAAVLAGCGSAQKPPPAAAEAAPPPLCSYATRTEGLSAESRKLAIATWFTFLLPGYKLASGEVARPLTNCTGQQVRWSTAGQDCPDLEGDLAYLPPVPVKPEDLVLSSTSDLERLVWAGADRLADGQAEGPVVLAEFTDKDVEVRAIGTLRALPQRGRLRLVKVQDRMQERMLLVAEGEHCPPSSKAAGPGKCFRGARLMVLAGQRFEPQPLRRDDGKCLEPAFFPTARTQEVTGRDGSRQQVALSSKLEFAPDRVLVHEDVEVRALEGGAPARLLRQAQADRTVRVRAGKLYASDASLWNRMLHEQ
jgi:hypothetical protein